MTPEERFDLANLTREMVDLAQRFLDGRATREELVAWAKAQHRPVGWPGVFPSATADALHTCLWNCDITLRQSGEPLVRHADLAENLRSVQEGELPLDPEEVAVLTLSIEQLATRAKARTTRIPIDGLGWFSIVRFASPVTGRLFGAISLREFTDPAEGSVVRTHRYPEPTGDRERVLADLFDTLAIDLGDTTSIRGVVSSRWELMRSDDNGNSVLVAAFSGYAKARARLTEFEALHHKQTYWLQQCA